MVDRLESFPNTPPRLPSSFRGSVLEKAGLLFRKTLCSPQLIGLLTLGAITFSAIVLSGLITIPTVFLVASVGVGLIGIGVTIYLFKKQASSERIAPAPAPPPGVASPASPPAAAEPPAAPPLPVVLPPAAAATAEAVPLLEYVCTPAFSASEGRPEPYEVLKQNCLTYYDGKLPDYIEFDNENKHMKLYKRCRALPDTAVKGIKPFCFSKYRGFFCLFGVDCVAEDLGAIATSVTTEELSREVDSKEILSLSNPRATRSPIDKTLVVEITRQVVALFTTDTRADLEIIEKERELAIKLGGQVIPMKDYLSLIEPAFLKILNITREMQERYLKVQELFSEPHLTDSTPAQILGAHALKAYVRFYYKPINDLMRSGTLLKSSVNCVLSSMSERLKKELSELPDGHRVPDRLILEFVFFIILIRHRLRTFEKLSFGGTVSPTLRRDANIDSRVIDKITAAYKTNQSVVAGAFFSTTLSASQVMGGGLRNVVFKIKPLSHEISKGVNISRQGGSVDEEEVLFDYGVAFRINKIQVEIRNQTRRGVLIQSKRRYKIDLEEIQVPEGEPPDHTRTIL